MVERMMNDAKRLPAEFTEEKRWQHDVEERWSASIEQTSDFLRSVSSCTRVLVIRQRFCSIAKTRSGLGSVWLNKGFDWLC